MNKSPSLPTETTTVLNETFTSPTADADLSKYNDDFAAKHPNSAPHLLAVYKARYALDPNTKSANEKGVIEVLELEGCTVEHAKRGLEMLEGWGSAEDVREEYRGKAGGRWGGFAV